MPRLTAYLYGRMLMPTKKRKPKPDPHVVDNLLPEDDEALLREIEHYNRTGQIISYAR